MERSVSRKSRRWKVCRWKRVYVEKVEDGKRCRCKGVFVEKVEDGKRY